MNQIVSPNGYLTREQSDRLCYFDAEIAGLGTVKIRKIGEDEWRAFMPLLPPVADDWPTVTEISGEGAAREASLAAHQASVVVRQTAEFEWLRREPDEEQVRYQGRRNDIAFRTIAACALAPTYTVAQARALGNLAVPLYVAIMRKSGLVTAPIPVAAPAEAEPIAP